MLLGFLEFFFRLANLRFRLMKVVKLKWRHAIVACIKKCFIVSQKVIVIVIENIGLNNWLLGLHH